MSAFETAYLWLEYFHLNSELQYSFISLDTRNISASSAYLYSSFFLD